MLDSLLQDNQKAIKYTVASTAALLCTVWLGRRQAIYYLEELILWLQGAHKRRQNNPFLKGLYEPVKNEQHSKVPVEGQLPKALNGAFVRTGPNPYFQPRGDYHVFDGDGMVFACRIKDGQVHFHNTFVETNALQHDKAAGYPILNKFGDVRGWSGLVLLLLNELKKVIGIFDGSKGQGTANTALVFHANQLLALHEGDLPYALKVACNGLLSTIGRVTFDGKVKHPFTAHPKVDPATGECFYIGYNPTKAPFAWYGMLDPRGNVVRDFPVPLPAGIMMHDFAITEDYAILIDAPLLFKPEVVVKYKTLPFWFDKERPTRFGVLPRYSKDASEVRWFEVPAVMMFHVSAAWQEGNNIHLFTACFDDFSIDFDTKERARRAAEGKQTSLQHLTEFILDLDTGKATQRWATDANTTGDFPVIPHSLMGRKVKYSYLALTKDMDNNPHFYGVAKIDMQAADKEKAAVGKLQYGDSMAGGEAFFVPDGTRTGGEDDGYLVTFTQKYETGKSEMAVFDALTMSSKAVARVPLPVRVPLGFHCYHMNEQQLQSQAAGV